MNKILYIITTFILWILNLIIFNNYLFNSKDTLENNLPFIEFNVILLFGLSLEISYGIIWTSGYIYKSQQNLLRRIIREELDKVK